MEVDRFLSRRGWTIKMRADLKSFLADVAALKPRVVLMSVDFHHDNVAKIRNLVETIYHSKVIDFSEESGAEGWARLKDIKSVNKIFGALTGPAIERVLSRLALESAQLDRGKAEKTLKDGSGDVLRQVLQPGDNQVRKPLTLTSRVTCIQVRTSVLSGHFLVAMGSDKVFDEAMTADLKNAICQLFVKAGFMAPLADMFTIDVRRVEFKKWALTAASFLERGVHQGNEVVMAFFPAEDELFTMEPSAADEKMACIPLDEIRAESKVDFEVYLHLPLNGKFVLYVSRGGWMSLQQQMNLQARGIAKLHVKKEESALLFRTRTHLRMDQSIADFYEASGSYAA